MNAAVDLEESYRLLHEGAVGRRTRRAVVRIAGPDARTYLQGQCTQEVSDLAVGASRFALLLSVQGKIEAFVRVRALAQDEFLLDSDVGTGDAVFERLRRFKVRVKADLELDELPAIALRGPGVLAPAERPGALVLPAFARPGNVGVDLLGPDAVLPDGVALGAEDAFAATRIEAGIPEMGAELDATTIPFEAGIVAETTSFTKGCYTGQELIARLDARGANVARRLRGVLCPPGPPEHLPAVGSELVVAGKTVGRLTSVAWSPRSGSAVALAYVQRAVEPPAAGELAGVDAAVRIAALPLVEA